MRKINFEKYENTFPVYERRREEKDGVCLHYSDGYCRHFNHCFYLHSMKSNLRLESLASVFRRVISNLGELLGNDIPTNLKDSVLSSIIRKINKKHKSSYGSLTEQLMEYEKFTGLIKRFNVRSVRVKNFDKNPLKNIDKRVQNLRKSAFKKKLVDDLKKTKKVLNCQAHRGEYNTIIHRLKHYIAIFKEIQSDSSGRYLKEKTERLNKINRRIKIKGRSKNKGKSVYKEFSNFFSKEALKSGCLIRQVVIEEARIKRLLKKEKDEVVKIRLENRLKKCTNLKKKVVVHVKTNPAREVRQAKALQSEINWYKNLRDQGNKKLCNIAQSFFEKYIPYLIQKRTNREVCLHRMIRRDLFDLLSVSCRGNKIFIPKTIFY